MSRYARKIDANQPEIVRALRLDAVGRTITYKRVDASRRNFAKATRLRRERIEALPPWRCEECGTERVATAHQKRQVYCSKTCMAAAYRKRLVGGVNPNFRYASKRICDGCGNGYSSYNKTRKYCSHKCYQAASNLITLPKAKRRDQNHAAIVGFFRARGVRVMDLSDQGRGMPDLLTWDGFALRLVEIKNPKTYYGQTGLNARQLRFQDEFGGSVYVVKTEADVEALVQRWRAESIGYMKRDAA